MFSRELRFDLEKETPGTIRYKERVDEGSQPIVGTLYVRKAALGTKRPPSLIVMIESSE